MHQKDKLHRFMNRFMRGMLTTPDHTNVQDEDEDGVEGENRQLRAALAERDVVVRPRPPSMSKPHVTVDHHRTGATRRAPYSLTQHAKSQPTASLMQIIRLQGELTEIRKRETKLRNAHVSDRRTPPNTPQQQRSINVDGQHSDFSRGALCPTLHSEYTGKLTGDLARSAPRTL